MKQLLFYWTFCLCSILVPDSTAQETCSFQLEVGQIEKYAFFTTEDYFFSPPTDSIHINYTGDTLIVEVIEEIAPNIYIIQEYFSPHSNIFSSGTNYYYGTQEDIYEMQWTFVNDSLLIENTEENTYYFWQNSHLTFFTNGVSLDPPLTNIVTFYEWKPIPTFGSHTYNRVINGHGYNRLIVHVDNSPMVGDGPGMTMTYEKAHGIVSSFTVSGWTGRVQGWMKL